ncbi:transposase [Streptomyces sp. NPDC015532]|uniref:IS701 family transposase n=1 Tax=Streptomyces sp. NPDC015532 TaxID=3364960 RepID=UPI003702BA29
MSRIAGRFTRVEPRFQVRKLVLGLLSDLPRENCWTIAEWAGERTPDGMQHLLGRAKWDADRVRDDVCDYVVDHLHDDQAVLVVDETGDVKKGTGTVGVQRQYTGTAGRIENAKVAVYLVYAGRRGHPGQEGAQAGPAEALRRSRGQGPPFLRLGSHRPRRPPPRESSAADPP